jgi:hypothetical protein
MDMNGWYLRFSNVHIDQKFWVIVQVLQVLRQGTLIINTRKRRL